MPEIDWNARYRGFLPIVMEAENPLIYYTELMCFVAVLAGPDTANASESFLAYMKHENCAVIIGENSAGTNGQPLMGSLSGKGSFGINTMKCSLLDGTSYKNVGIAPDIYVEKRIEGLKVGFDRALDEAIRFLREAVTKS